MPHVHPRSRASLHPTPATAAPHALRLALRWLPCSASSPSFSLCSRSRSSSHQLGRFSQFRSTLVCTFLEGSLATQQRGGKM